MWFGFLVARPEVEIADVGRLARRLVGRAVEAARTEDRPLRRLLLDHLGPTAAALPTVSATWPMWDHVNVQVGLDAWLAASPGRRHEVVGISGAGMARHMDITLSDFVQTGHGAFASAGATGVITEAVPCGPGGQTRACVINGIYLVSEGEYRLVVMILPVSRGPRAEIVVQVASPRPETAEAALASIRELALAGSVFRGQVLSFGPELLGPGWGSAPLNFLERRAVDRSEVILPPGLLAEIERQVLGIRRHSGRLLASGQHLRRGVLLHGAPGTGKTHTVSYLLRQLPDVTAVVISGRAMGAIVQACSLARSLQPAVVVVEDVDLIAEERASRPGQQPLLFQLMNEMEGLNSAEDITFLLTTNRADLLEPALAARPGRVDLAAELPLPDADARRALIRLYQGNLVLDATAAGLDDVIARTEGVTAPFLKELLRRAALLAAESESESGAGEPGPGDAEPESGAGGPGPGIDQPIRVRDEQLAEALDHLLDERGTLTRVLLGGGERG
jgi:ATPase family associated with various cellular activities (AAA)